jgi:hypothetical protein
MEPRQKTGMAPSSRRMVRATLGPYVSVMGPTATRATMVVVTAEKLAMRICFFLRCRVFLITEARGAGANQATKAYAHKQRRGERVSQAWEGQGTDD